jgi:hypothetical protein
MDWAPRTLAEDRQRRSGARSWLQALQRRSLRLNGWLASGHELRHLWLGYGAAQYPFFVTLGLESADEPNASVCQTLVIDVDRVLGRQDNP